MPRSTLVAVVLAAILVAGCAQPKADADALPGPAVTPADTAPGNLPPLASLQATPGSGRLPLDVVVSFGGRDPEGDAVSWTLDFGDGSPKGTGTQLPSTIEHTYTRSGTFRIALTVSDGQESSVASVTVRGSATQTTTGPPATATSTPSPSPQPQPTATGTSTSTSTSTSGTASSTSATTTSTTTTTTASTTTTTSDTSTTTSETTTTTSDTSTTTSDPSASSSTSESDTGTPPPGNETAG